MRDLQFFGQELILAVDHIANGDARKLHVRLLRAVRGGTGNPIGQSIDADDGIARRIHALTGAEIIFQFLRGSAKPGREKDRIRLAGIQVSVDAISDVAIANDFAAFFLKLPSEANCCVPC